MNLECFGFFFYFDSCVNCIKGKLATKGRKIGVIGSEKVLLEVKRSIIHVTMGCFRYFITFIDDFSRDEFYGKYNETGRNPKPFARFLHDYGTETQYTMPNMPQQNEVGERQNRTHMDMVRCILSHSILLEFLWGNAL
ncbi:hypothetical protein CR513_25214, partial [Mucuna pruriens]